LGFVSYTTLPPIVSPSYLLPTPSYFLPFPPTLLFFHPKHYIVPINFPLFALPSSTLPSPMLLLPLLLLCHQWQEVVLLAVTSLPIPRSYVTNNYIVVNSKKLFC
jgi:hypothetical protein